MRVTPYSQMGGLQPSQTTRRPEAGGAAFRLPEDKKETKAATQAQGHAATSSIGSLETLLALQAVSGDKEKRRRSLKRGRTILDLLDELKISILGGQIDPSTLLRLNLATLPTETSGDGGLDSLLEQIDLRAQVELAKIEVANKAL